MSSQKLKNLVKLIGGIAVAVSLLLSTSVHADISTYTIIDLSARLGGPESGPWGINNKGQVVGGDRTSPACPNPGCQAVLWLPAPDYGLPAGLNDLGTLPSGGQSYALGINEAGQAVGRSGDFYSGDSRAFIWDNTNGMHDLGSLPGNTEAGAYGINGLGQVVGYSDNFSGDPSNHAVLWSNGMIVNLGTLAGTTTGGLYDNALSINDSGQVVGSSTTASGYEHGFLWTPTTPNGVSGSMQDLGTIGGTFSQALRVNESGKVTGDSTIVGDAAHHAFLWTPTTPNRTSGSRHDLGTLGGTNSYAWGINEPGQVVGEAQIVGNLSYHAFLYSNGVMTDLNTLIPADSGWELIRATRINDAGQIIGYGIVNGEIHGFLLTPVNITPTPTPTPQVGPPTSKDQCKNDGWRIFNTPRTFKNQGDCVSFVETGR